MTLKQYLLLKGYRLTWVAKQIGMNYPRFWHSLEEGRTWTQEHAKAIEALTQGDWVAVPSTINRLKNRWILALKEENE